MESLLTLKCMLYWKKKPNKEQNVQVSDTTNDQQNSTAGYLKRLFLRIAEHLKNQSFEVLWIQLYSFTLQHSTNIRILYINGTI